VVSTSDLPIIVQGATGTGKEGAARAIHEWSGRKGPFVAVNCAALPENLAEGELFGYRKGAFTSADRASSGLLRAAHEGTLFLDEISDLPLSIQPKLLRALERREVTPLGETTPVPVDIRLVTATQESLRKAVDSKRFRSDLLARLEGLSVTLPTLRERAEEIPSLLSKMIEAQGRAPCPPRLDPLLVERLCMYQWPFNVRELAQFVRRITALYPEVDVLDHAILAGPAEASILEGLKADADDKSGGGAEQTIPTVEVAAVQVSAQETPGLPNLTTEELADRSTIVRALAEAVGSQTEAARRLGISRSTLIERMKRYQVPRPRARD
jgi:DNA-binding NtrC family response regulator